MIAPTWEEFDYMRVEQPAPITTFLSSAEKTFEIPVYQRNYVWKVEDCMKLFDDVLEAIKGKKHYFGNIVFFIKEHSSVFAYTRYILIDGQQRITSTMLLLTAIRDEEENATIQAIITKKYLRNEDASEDLRIKLKQVETDRKVYEDIINGCVDDLDTSSVIYRNYKKFRTLVKNAKQELGYSSEDIMSGIDKLQIIAIDLDSERESSESPQVIFESINATGEPLSTADLLRNFLLLEVGTDKQEDYYKNYWLTIERHIGNENISDYIRRYLTLKNVEDIKKDTEYKEFKRSYKNYFNNAEEAIKELTHFSKYYRWIKNPDSINKEHPKTSAILQDLDDLRMLPATPVIMWLLEKADVGEIDFEDVNNTLEVVASWSFRARVTNIISTGEIGTILTTKILDLLINKRNDNTCADYIWFELSNYRMHDIYASDAMFKDAFMHYDFYKNYRRYVQEKLAARISKDKHSDIMLESIEHVMPQTLDSRKWPNITVSEHAEWVNTIGNLTPLNQPHNSEASNNSFADKIRLIRQSDWKITRDIDIEKDWTIDTIKERGKFLAEQAVHIWRPPAERTREIEAVQRTSKNNRSQKFMDWINEMDLPYVKIDTKHTSNSYLRFTTDYMSGLIPARDNEAGSWRSGQAYYYELKTDASGWVRIGLAFNSVAASDQQLSGQQRVMAFLDKYPPKKDWIWFNPIGWTLDYDDGDEVLKDEVARVVTVEIPRFEHELDEFIQARKI